MRTEERAKERKERQEVWVRKVKALLLVSLGTPGTRPNQTCGFDLSGQDSPCAESPGGETKQFTMTPLLLPGPELQLRREEEQGAPSRHVTPGATVHDGKGRGHALCTENTAAPGRGASSTEAKLSGGCDWKAPRGRVAAG